ncbi:MAG: protocatechuate 3,4-dioxygenase subunit alpha [Actinomycetota bacterium]|nr:MAG: protocatechuate 3,4-dioxygenase subunit alpha [Actinomycetota bacterium]
MNSQIGRTPSQTIGPFFKFGTEWIADEHIVSEDHEGAIVLTGAVYDGAGNPVPDAMLEIWQADENGNFPPDTPESWTGFARRLTDASGEYRIVTVKPGVVAAVSGEPQAPHISMVVFARGLLKPVFTRVYFDDDAEANASDPLLSALEDAEARSSLLAGAIGNSSYRFDIRLQDSSRGLETQFFAFDD